LARLNPKAVPEINNPQQIKNQLLSELPKLERVKTQVEANRANTRLGLVKKLKSILEPWFLVLYFSIGVRPEVAKT